MISHYGDMNLGRKDEDGVRAFYRGVPTGGYENRAGPSALQEELNIDKTEFERRKNILQTHGLISTVQGGGIYRTPRGDVSDETYYYKPIMRELELNWAEQPGREYHQRQRFLRVLDTHHQGATAGRWRRPDITLLGGKVLRYLPGKFLDVVTFEVKWGGMPIEGLYEALAHRRRANFAYVVCVWPEDWRPPSPTEQATMVAEATRQGIGVILARQEDDYQRWEELVEPVRHEPDPQHLHDFLENHCNLDGCLAALRSWLDRDPSELPPVTDSQLRRLYLTTEELNVARAIVEMIEDSDEGWGMTNFRELASDSVLRHVRKVLRDAHLIQTVQGGAIRRARSTL